MWARRVAALVTIATFTAACGGAPPEPVGSSAAVETVATTTPEPPPDGPRLWIRDGDVPVEFDNGATVTSNGLDIEIYLSPYPPARSANVDFYVLRSGIPVDDANVTLQFDMTVMEHGPFALNARPTGGGHYLAPLDFIMTGDFLVNVAFDVGDAESVVNLFVRAIR